jgi:hypothetical protein
MTRTAIALLLAMPMLAACGGSDREEGPLVLRMDSPGIGDLEIGDGYLRFDDGSTLPIRRVDEGVYAVPSRPARTPAGADICQGRPAGWFVLHETEDGLYAMNWGDWAEAPEAPPADVATLPGACATFMYRRA